MLKKIAWVLLVLFLIAQVIRPDQKNPAVVPAYDFKNVANPPTEVLDLLRAAYYDCHSIETRYPWYSQISPVSWWLANHVQEGREHLNFSEYGKLSVGDQAEVLGEAAEAVQEGEMPMASYTWIGMHPEAKLSSAQRNALITWLDANGGEKQGGEKQGGDDD